ncbi:MAG TPA: ATP-binding protein [Steroidobacteraceae bacterium]|nr:ATP-binding protein [Steroidobacteraceae bacterium]
MKFSGADRTRQILTVGVGVLLTLIMGAVLIVGFRLATRVTVDIGALETASVLQTYPGALAQHLTALRDRLEARAYAGQALADLKATADGFDRDLQQLVEHDIAASSELTAAMQLWQQYGPALGPVLAFNEQPYVDSDEAGSSLSRAGRAHYADVKRAQTFARDNARRLADLIGASATQLQTGASAAAARLRLLLSAGVLATLVLAAAAAYFQLTRARHERVAREAQDQTRDILKTVKEGFFLLDADYRIGAVWSDALTRLFGRNDFAGLSFEELLRNLVQASTLATATKYIKLLWGDRAHENLMRTINPLGQLEIHVDNGHGGRETRFLQFDFHRVLGDKGVKHVLVSVTDITSNVLLARELHESQEAASAQMDMMLGVMHMDPVQLVSFLDTSDASVQLINSILKEPARTDADFRKKLDGLFRELHSIKGEAAALNLMSIASRVHTFEDAVSELRKRTDLTGNEFLPLVLKLDELMAHLKTVREVALRVTSLRDTPAPVDHTKTQVIGVGVAAKGRAAAELSQTLQGLAERLASDHRKRFKLVLNGLEEIPGQYVPALKDVLIQMLRNSAVHGIEPGEVRRAQTKEDVGAVRAEFRRVPEGYELVFEDDGAGLAPDQLKAAAVKKQFVTAQEAAGMDTRAALALIFKPGFTTQAQVSMDAGRGVGMDVVARSIYSLGGKIGVSTNPGKFTRFRIVLPASEADSAVA